MQKFNRLEFIEFGEPQIMRSGKKLKIAHFKCDCGTIIKKDYYLITSNTVKMCPKCSRENARLKKITHGNVKHKLYRKWQDMLNRCRNPKVDRYKNYGGRGIRVCQEWTNDFKTYFDWCMANGWEEGLQVDRINNDGNYEPTNCRIVKPLEQHYNKQNTVFVEYNGQKYCLAKLCNLISGME